MFPDNAMHDFTNHALIYTVVLSQACLCNLAFVIALSDFNHLALSQLCPMLIDASIAASLVYLVLDIVHGRAKEEMRRIDAQPIIATMADKHSIGNRPIVHLIGNSVSKYHAATEVLLDLPIPVATFDGCPNPTTIGFLHFAPKALLNCLRSNAIAATCGIARFAAKLGTASGARDAKGLLTVLTNEMNLFRGCAIMGMHAKPDLSCATPLAAATAQGHHYAQFEVIIPQLSLKEK